MIFYYVEYVGLGVYVYFGVYVWIFIYINYYQLKMYFQLGLFIFVLQFILVKEANIFFRMIICPVKTFIGPTVKIWQQGEPIFIHFWNLNQHFLIKATLYNINIGKKVSHADRNNIEKSWFSLKWSFSISVWIHDNKKLIENQSSTTVRDSLPWIGANWSTLFLIVCCVM